MKLCAESGAFVVNKFGEGEESREFPTFSKDVPQGLENFNFGDLEVFFNTFLKAPEYEKVGEKDEVVLVFGVEGTDSEELTQLSCKKLPGVVGGGVGCQY